MRRTLPFAFAASFGLALHAQTPLIVENFDAYANGNLVAQTIGLPWSTWSAAPGGSEDTPISNEQAVSGTLSMKVSTTAVGGGPTDMLLLLGDRTTGVYGLTWKMYVPTGQGGYFNLQHDESPGVQWAVEVYLPPGGTGNITANGIETAIAYPHDQWFDVVFAIDLDAIQAALSVAGGTPHVWAFNTQATGTAGLNQLGAVNFFAYAGGAAPCTYYIDDLAFIEVTGVGIAETMSDGSVSVFPNPANDIITVEANAGSEALIALLDPTGREVIAMRSFRQYGDLARTQLDLGGLPAGTYLVRVQDGSTVTVRRVQKL